MQADKLCLGYNGHPVVRDFDLAVQPGEVVALLGPNGAGKTTTMLGLAGALPALGGELRFADLPTAAPLHRRARAHLSFVTEERSVFMRLSVEDNLRVGRCDKRRALAIFPELEPLLKRPAGLLSGGEQQMLTLARALARRPLVLLADELSLGLGPLVVQRLLRAVRDAADQDGVAAVLVEQHVKQVMRVADICVVMRRGRIVLKGTAAEVGARLTEVEATYLTGDDESFEDRNRGSSSFGRSNRLRYGDAVQVRASNSGDKEA